MEYRVNGKKERPTVLKVLNEHNTQHHLPLLSTAANITASDVQRAITIKSDWLRAVKSGHARIEFTPSAAPASAKGKLVTASAAEILLEVNAVWSTTTRTHEALRPALPAQLLPHCCSSPNCARNSCTVSILVRDLLPDFFMEITISPYIRLSKMDIHPDAATKTLRRSSHRSAPWSSSADDTEDSPAPPAHNGSRSRSGPTGRSGR